MKPATTIKTRTGEILTVLSPGTLSAKSQSNSTAISKSRYKNRASQKGKTFTSDYIDYNKALLKGKELLWNDKTMVIGFYIIFSINTGLRISDIRKIIHADLIDKKAGDILSIIEGKTKKVRHISINSEIVDCYAYLQKRIKATRYYNDAEPVFKSQKGTVYATVTINTLLKDKFAGYAKNISSHSLRKSFGREVWTASGESEKALIKLSDIFKHSNMSITRRYLGITSEEIADCYLNLGKR